MLPLFISYTITEFSVTSSMALNNCGKRYCQTLGKKPNPCKRQWLVAMVGWKNIHAVCCEDNFFPKENFKLFNSLFYSVCTLFFQYVGFLLPVCLCAIFGTYVRKINAVSCHIARYTYSSLGLFTFARIACLLQLWIKTSHLDYAIWATHK